MQAVKKTYYSFLIIVLALCSVGYQVGSLWQSVSKQTKEVCKDEATDQESDEQSNPTIAEALVPVSTATVGIILTAILEPTSFIIYKEKSRPQSKFSFTLLQSAYLFPRIISPNAP